MKRNILTVESYFNMLSDIHEETPGDLTDETISDDVFIKDQCEDPVIKDTKFLNPDECIEFDANIKEVEKSEDQEQTVQELK